MGNLFSDSSNTSTSKSSSSSPPSSPSSAELNGKLRGRFETFALNNNDSAPLSSSEIAQLQKITRIPKSFLNASENPNFNQLTTISFSSFSAVTRIESNCLHCAINLTSLDCSGLVNLASFGDSFAFGCYNLTSVNFQNLKKVTSLGTKFLRGCTKLPELDISSMTNLKVIEHGFCEDCKTLTSVSLPSGGSIEAVGFNFLSCAQKLKKIDLQPLVNLRSIDSHFLSNCTSLRVVDISPLANSCQKINYNFLYKTKTVLVGLERILRSCHIVDEELREQLEKALVRRKVEIKVMRIAHLTNPNKCHLGNALREIWNVRFLTIAFLPSEM